MTSPFRDFYRGKRVLVTGHTGFKGSWLTQWLLDLGAEVAGYSKDVPSEPSHFEVLGLEHRLGAGKHFHGDIRDPMVLEGAFARFKPEIVLHLAAQALVRDSYDDPATTFDTNVVGTVRVLDAVRKTPSVRLALIITTDKCYENKEWEFGYRETDRLGGKDPYSASKACTELAFHSMYKSFFESQDRVRLASVRAGNVIGGADWAKDRIVPDCMRAWSKGQKPLIRNPHSTRPWQHVLEPLGGYLWLGARLGLAEAGERARFQGESFNFGPNADANQTVGSLIEEMQKTWTGTGVTIDPASAGGKKEAVLLKLNCERALDRLQWSATLSFAETVSLTAEWYRDYYAGKKGMAELTSEQIRRYERFGRERGRSWAR